MRHLWSEANIRVLKLTQFIFILWTVLKTKLVKKNIPLLRDCWFTFDHLVFWHSYSTPTFAKKINNLQTDPFSELEVSAKRDLQIIQVIGPWFSNETNHGELGIPHFKKPRSCRHKVVEAPKIAAVSLFGLEDTVGAHDVVSSDFPDIPSVKSLYHLAQLAMNSYKVVPHPVLNGLQSH